MKKLAIALLAILASAPARAGGYIQQSTFNLGGGTIAGLDRDLVGNLYVFSMPAGASTYRVTGYQTHAITPLFSFDTGISTFAAFAVEDSGIVDVVDVSSGIALKRFTNTGAFIGQSTYSLTTSPYLFPQLITASIDKANHRVYATYQLTNGLYHPLCLGCPSGPSSVTHGYINQYDFSGNQLLMTTMAGDSNTPGTCYTPYKLATDPQGNLYVADPNCLQVVEYSPAGSPVGSVPASWTTNFQPRGLWTDSASSVYISEPVCSPAGCPWGIVKLSGGSFQTSFVADSAIGSAWDQRILFINSSGSQPLQRFIFDGAPSVPAETGPLTATGQHSSSAALAWQASSDSDGDPVAYSVYVGTTPGQLALAGVTAQNNFASQPLAFGTTYYWQVVSQDSYLGLPLQQTPAPVESFTLGFLNNPPGTFGVASGTGTTATRSNSVTLAWQASVDPDGDPLLYNVSWQPAGQSSATIITTAGASLVMTSLSYGTSYSWSVIAADPYGATTPMSGGTQIYHPVFKNSPPSAAAYVSTAGSYSLHTVSPNINLSWLPSGDPDGDVVTYQLDMQTSTGALPSLALGSATNATLSLQLETTYTWRVEAFDPYGGASTGAWTSFIVHLANQPPSPVVYTSVSSVTTRAASYGLSWLSSGDPDGDAVTYNVYVSTYPAFQSLVQQGSQTSYAAALRFGTTIYWRVSAVDAFGAHTDGSLQSLLPIFTNSPPPAPPITGGIGSMSTHSLAPSAHLAWSAVQDPDGDPVVYQLSVGVASTTLSPVQLTTSTAYDQPALYGSTYYWEIAALDAFGAASTSAVQSVSLAFQNNPPGVFAVLSGTGTHATRTTSELLSWGGSVDPDGDGVIYALSESTAPSGLAVVQTSSATSYPLTFQFGTTYYWSVSAFDGFGGTTPVTGGTQSFLPTFLNQAPQTVQLMPPFNGSPVISTMRSNATISWNQVTTPQNDPVAYTVYLGNSASGVQPLVQIGQVTQLGVTSLSLRPMTTTPQAQVQTDGNVITLNLTGLDYYRTYFIQIQAANPYGATSLTPFQTFSLASANGFPLAYNYPNPFSPLRGGTNIVFNAPPSGYARATVSVYSELGDLLSKTEYANIPPGISQQPFNGRDRYGRALFNGSYICRVKFEGPDDKATFYLLVVK